MKIDKGERIIHTRKELINPIREYFPAVAAVFGSMLLGTMAKIPDMDDS